MLSICATVHSSLLLNDCLADGLSLTLLTHFGHAISFTACWRVYPESDCLLRCLYSPALENVYRPSCVANRVRSDPSSNRLPIRRLVLSLPTFGPRKGVSLVSDADL